MATSGNSDDVFSFPPGGGSSAVPSSRSSRASSTSAPGSTTANSARRTSNPSPTIPSAAAPASTATTTAQTMMINPSPPHAAASARRPSSTGPSAAAAATAGQKRKAGQLLDLGDSAGAAMDNNNSNIDGGNTPRVATGGSAGTDSEVKPKRARRSVSAAVASEDEGGSAPSPPALAPVPRRARSSAAEGSGGGAETRRGSASSSLRPSPPRTSSSTTTTTTTQPPHRTMVNGQEAGAPNNSDDAVGPGKVETDATKRATALKKEAAAKVSTRSSARKRPLAEVDASIAHEHDTRKRGKAMPAHPASSSTTAAPSTGAGAASSSTVAALAAQEPPEAQPASPAAGIAGRKTAGRKAAANKPVETEESKRRASKSIQDAVTDLLDYDASALPDDNALSKAKKALIRKAQSDPVFLLTDKLKMKARCSKLAIDVFEIEEKAINDGTHPCFGELEKKLEKRLAINENTKRHKLDWYDTACDAAIAQADCNFIVRRGDKRRSLIRSYQEQIWKLKDEKRVLEDDSRWQSDLSVETRARRRQVEIEELRRSATGVPPYVSEFPQHYRDMLVENRRNGGPVIIPPMLCRGLHPSEIDSDLDVIRAAASGLSNHDA
ncbi:hypothetical protein HDU87_003698 [Geranomyces variabilis]|uniref:Uncharacterized protein n=1 Tax=Geranomyces variabilis TaxID=109894 RepID=A0AAD5TJG2_9FUNG|nr:hypothetical protein HDU87_003698 [Geranomyces variabilis]